MSPSAVFTGRESSGGRTVFDTLEETIVLVKVGLIFVCVAKAILAPSFHTCLTHVHANLVLQAEAQKQAQTTASPSLSKQGNHLQPVQLHCLPTQRLLIDA
jgi:hypothetical protein